MSEKIKEKVLKLLAYHEDMLPDHNRSKYYEGYIQALNDVLELI